MICLARMKGIRVDAEKRTVRAEGGCTWGDLDHATHAFGLATPGGVISTTGIAGLTLGRIRVPVADARAVVRQPALGRRGHRRRPTAGGRCHPQSGVVLGHPRRRRQLRGADPLEFRLHPQSMVFAGPILYPTEQAGAVMRLYREFMRTAPREVSAFFAFIIVPPDAPFPENLWNKTVSAHHVLLRGQRSGAGRKGVQPLRSFGPPLFVLNMTMPYPAVQSLFDGLLPPGLHHYWKSDFVVDLTDEQIAVHEKFGPRIPTVASVMHIYPLDGAIQDPEPADTAFAYRNVRFVHIIGAVTPDSETPDATGPGCGILDALHPHSAGGTYVNFLMEEGDARVSASYSGNHARLGRSKASTIPEPVLHQPEHQTRAGAGRSGLVL